jgi:catecholate siderophore receptor
MVVGLIYRSDIFTATDNTVALPAYFRADAAAFWTLTRQVAMQVNVENLLGEDYYLYANGNNNITTWIAACVSGGPDDSLLIR